MNDPLVFTHSAAAKVWELIQEEGNMSLKLRVYVTGGGCSGFQYGFTFDETVNEDDTVVTQSISTEEDDEEGEGSGSGTVQLLVDPMSFQYLTGSEIDYKEDIEGAQFIIRNPNAKTTCGCGSSFSA
ncbi:MAG: iron-sulfur cluster insertion protein ErpA [uncultured bacterium]|nr:MAG: iron-sulfur cluster insertion protein ErpA [uncultured bacterium]